MMTFKLIITTIAILAFVAILVAMFIQQHQSWVVRNELRIMDEQQQALYDVASLNKLRQKVLKLAVDYSVDYYTLMLIDSLEQRIALRVSDLQ
jgi:hypothetical protein